MGYEGMPFLVVSWDVARAGDVSRLVRHAARRPVHCAADAAQARLQLRERRDWAGLVVELERGHRARAGLDLVEEVVRLSPEIPALVHAAELDRPGVNRAVRLGVAVAWSPLDRADLRSFLAAARSLESRRSGIDPRLQHALDVEVARSGIAVRRAAELLRRAVSGQSPAEIQHAMRIGADCYAYHVRKLLRATASPDLQSLVIRVMRRALGVVQDGAAAGPPGPPSARIHHLTDRHGAPGTEAQSGVIDRRTLVVAIGAHERD